jgi:hypothetical protein
MDCYSNGIQCFCLPDTACCIMCNQNPLDIDECPIGNEQCDGDCIYYTEDNERK